MNAEQMYNEFEIAYEAIASGDAPGYEPYEVSILLTQAQEVVLKALLETGIEYNDKKSVVVGPHVYTTSYNQSTTSTIYPSTFIIYVDPTDFWAVVNERVIETSGSDSIDVRPIDHAFFAANVDNPYKKPSRTRYFWRFIEQANDGDARWLIYGPSAIYVYYINYLKKPDPIIVPGVDANVNIDGTVVTTSISTYGQDCAYNSIIHRDIIETAAAMGKAFMGDAQGVQLLRRN